MSVDEQALTAKLLPKERNYDVLGGTVCIKAGADDTGGALTLQYAVSEPGFGPPMHTHSREDEGFFILEGTVRFWVGDSVLDAGAGTFVWAPRGLPHRYQNVTEVPSRMLIFYTPGGMERFFADASQWSPETGNGAELAEIFARYGVALNGGPGQA